MKAEYINNLCPMTEAEKLQCIYKPSLKEYSTPWSIFDKTRRLSAEMSFKTGWDARGKVTKELYEVVRDLIQAICGLENKERTAKALTTAYQALAHYEEDK